MEMALLVYFKSTNALLMHNMRGAAASICYMTICVYK